MQNSSSVNQVCYGDMFYIQCMYVFNTALFSYLNPFAPELLYEAGYQGRYNQILASTLFSLNVGGI